MIIYNSISYNFDELKFNQFPFGWLVIRSVKIRPITFLWVIVLIIWNSISHNFYHLKFDQLHFDRLKFDQLHFDKMWFEFLWLRNFNFQAFRKKRRNKGFIQPTCHNNFLLLEAKKNVKWRCVWNSHESWRKYRQEKWSNSIIRTSKEYFIQKKKKTQFCLQHIIALVLTHLHKKLLCQQVYLFIWSYNVCNY